MPTVTTTTATSITTTSASSGGGIASDGGASVTSRGVCWSSTSSSPTIALSTKTSNGSGTGSFTSSLTGLTSGTTYYVRAYATNSAGTAYGSVVTFNTISGITLPSVTIGTQIWTTYNLVVDTYSDGTVIPQVTDPDAWANLTTGAWCYYDNDPGNENAWGKLYNWYAVAGIWNEASKTDVSQRKKLAPTGYHVPSEDEWRTLTERFGGPYLAGGDLKETGGQFWQFPNDGATNSSGFTAFGAGYRYQDGSFTSIRKFGYWWSSTEYYDYGGIQTLEYANTFAYFFNYPKIAGCSVRLIKN